MVQPGKNGELAGADAELEAVLERLTTDPARRGMLGGAARRTLEQRYSLRAAAPQFAALLRRAAESP